MKFMYKALAVFLAVMITVSFASRRVKAVAEGLTAVALEAVAVALTHYLCEVVVPAVAEGLQNASSQYKNAINDYNYAVSEDFRNKIDELTDLYSLRKAEQEVQSFISENISLYAIIDYSPVVKLTFNTNLAQDYLNRQIALGEYELAYVQLAYNTLLAVQSQEFLLECDDYLGEYNTIKTTGNAFEQLYGNAFEWTMRDFLDVGFEMTGGITSRQGTFTQIQDLSSNLLDLADMFDAAYVGIDEIVFNNGVASDNLENYYFYGLISDGNIVAAPLYTGISTQGNKQLSRWNSVPYQKILFTPSFDSASWYMNLERSTSNDGNIYNSGALFISLNHFYYTSEKFATADTFVDNTAVHGYLYLFDNLVQAENMRDYVLDKLAVGSFLDEEAPPIVVDVNPSSIEKAIEKAKEALGVDDVDIVVSPGATLDEDGEEVYNPSISIAGTDINDFADSTNPEGSDDDLFPPAVVFEGTYPLYEQCKALLTNLFNYNDLVQPPSFKFYWDSNGDGKNEVYDVLDLSFLETSLNNKNMVDKGWWSTPIKVIDIIRYVIAAVVYGLFVMRLIKRLPYFYGGGTWANL